MAKQQKPHRVVLNNSEGGVEVYPLKQWLRQNPQHLPQGMNPDTNTSHELRRALQRSGWVLEIRVNEVLLIKPTEDGDVSFADQLSEEDALTDDAIYQEEIGEVREITFGLERDLQTALRANIEQLEAGLKIFDEGRERTTEAGRIDITAIDAQGNLVVIELKAGIAPPDVVTQILAYMSTVSDTDNRPVRGILVAGDFHKRVLQAAKVVQNLELVRYSFQFRFEPVK